MSATRRGGRRTVAHGHVDWLRLVESSGPFLSLRVLGEAFPQGMERPDDESAVVDELRLALDAWDVGHGDPAVHTGFVRFMLERVLEYPAEVLPTDAGTIRRWSTDPRLHRLALTPDMVVGDPEAPALLVVVAEPGAALERAFTDRGLFASHGERMRLLLHATGAPLGLVTSGEKWTLVHQPREGTPTFATWDAPLLVEERGTLRALRSLLGVRRTLATSGPQCLLGLLESSAEDEREVTDALGEQARRVVELLVAAFDDADRAEHGRLLRDIEPPTLYEAAVAVTMRLVFMFTAEARDLFPSDGAWLESYAVTPMRARLLEARGRDTEDVLARRFDAWPALLAAFRAVHGGVEHEAVRLPGHGGGLFEPARFPFLEAGAGCVSNAVVLRILDDLQTLEVAVPGGRERRPLSYRALGEEQIGHVYERLLGHWAVRATAPALGFAGKREPEIALEDLEAAEGRGEGALLELLARRTGRGESAIRTARTKAPDARRLARLRAACDNDDDLLDRVVPYDGLLRTGHDGDPCVFLPGRVYVTDRPGGRAFQSHYTPRSLTSDTVRYALEPVAYEGPAEGWEPDDWRLRDPHELLALRICDVAVGSAAFLVEACRQLADLLVTSWEAHAVQRPVEYPSDPEDRVLLARRLVAERCLYGVDANPLAIDIAKVSLWLVTLRRGRPFTFLDHALRVGDSLVGLTDAAHLESLSMSDRAPLLPVRAREGVAAALRRGAELRTAIAATDALDLPQSERKRELLERVDHTTAGLRAAADLVVFADLATGSRGGPDAAVLVEPHLPAVTAALETGDPPDPALVRGARELLFRNGEAIVADIGLRPFHWLLEFPEVFGSGRRGFDVIVGNPPFLGGTFLTGTFGTAYREQLVGRLANGTRGNADLCAYFFLRAAGLLTSGGCISLLATNTIAQGDTREVGLAQMTARGATIFRAVPTRRWPTEANLEIAQIWMTSGPWNAGAVLNGGLVDAITPYLARPRRATGEPKPLVENRERSFNGSKVYGQGFVLEPAAARAIIEREPHNAEVLFPYLSGEDLQSRPDQSPSRWVINFFDWSIEKAREYTEPFAIAERLVKPERQGKNRAATRDRWWIYGENRPGLRRALTIHQYAFIRSLHGSNHTITSGPTDGIVYSHGIGVFVADGWGEFSVIQSAVHEVWIWRQASSMRTDIRYTPSDCFETFPFPDPLPSGDAGHTLHDFRAERTRARAEGLTALTNRVNDPEQCDLDIVRLRELMVRLDTEVAAAYGWDDLALNHGFHDTRIGRRFTVSEAAREELVDRLLELNHARYADEVARGLHQPKKSGAKRARPAAARPEQTSLLDEAP